MRLRHLVTAAAVVVTVALVAPTALAADAAAGPPVSLFIQVSTLSSETPATVSRWLDEFCRTAPQRPHELVLQEVVDARGALATRYLDVITPRLPGGSKACTSSAYVGTADVPNLTGEPYAAGVRSPAWRDRYLAVAHDASRAFLRQYPQIRAGWYVSVEANANDLYYADIADAYRTLIAAELGDLADAARRPAMWSPAFWYPYGSYRANTAGMAGLAGNMKAVLQALRGAGAGLTRLDLQDFVGGSSCQPAWNRTTPRDAIGWAHFVDGLGTGDDVRINVERYSIDCLTSGLLAVPAGAVRQREAQYVGAGVGLGASFELRYWITQER